MSSEVKIALGIGAVAVVGYFVIQMINKPASVVPKNTAPSGTTTAFISGIISGLGNLISSKNTPSNAPLTNIGTPGFPPVTFDTGDLTSINEFRNESPDMTDAQRDAAILG
jgi:hypothetical protein